MLHARDLWLSLALSLLTWISNFGQGGFVYKRTAYRGVCVCVCVCVYVYIRVYLFKGLRIFWASQWPGITSLLPSLEDGHWVTNEIWTWRKTQWPWEPWRVPLCKSWCVSIQTGAEGNGVKDREAHTRDFHVSQLTWEGRQARQKVPVTTPNLGDWGRAGQAEVWCQGPCQRQIPLRHSCLMAMPGKTNKQTKQTDKQTRAVSVKYTGKTKNKKHRSLQGTRHLLTPWSTSAYQLPTS